MVNMPTGRVFNFADNENNYFAVKEKVKSNLNCELVKH